MQLKKEIFSANVFDNRTVHIRKKVLPSAQGRHRHEREGRKIHKTQAGKAGTTWKLPDLDKTSVLNTGLWKLAKNPYYKPENGESEEELPANYAGQGISESKTISWQMLFEIKHNKPIGFYASERVQIGRRTKTYVPTFMQEFHYYLLDGVTTLDLANPKDQLMYFFALNSHGKFARNENELKFSPRATHYLCEINEPEENKRVKLKAYEDCLYYFGDLKRKYSEDKVVKFATILKVIRGKVSFNGAANAISEYLSDRELKTETLNKRYETFIQLYELMGKDGGEHEFEAKAMLQRLLNAGIIVNNGETYTWAAKKDTDLYVIGKTYARAIAFLMDADKADYIEELVEELKFKLS